MGVETLQRSAADDGSGNERDWRKWGAETDGMGEQPHYGKVYVARPVGRASVFGVSPGVAPDAYRGWVMPQLAGPAELGAAVLRGSSPN